MLGWLTDVNKLGSICSIIGFIVTIFLFIEARKIRNSFLRRARLPQINRDLKKATSLLSENLKNWDIDRKPALKIFSNIKAILENIRTKLPPEEKNQVEFCLSRMQTRRYGIFKRTISELQEDSAWEIYTELSGLVTSLDQLAKDSKWD